MQAKFVSTLIVAVSLGLPIAPRAQDSVSQIGAGASVQGAISLWGSNTIGAQLAPDLLTAWGRSEELRALKVEEGSDPEERALVMEAAETSRRLRAVVAAHGTGTGFPALAAGKADIAMASRPIMPAEIQMIEAAGLGDPTAVGNTTVLSLDGVIVIVHPDNRVATLTMDQVRGLFAGQIKNWSAVGGADRPVTLYRRDDKSGTTDTFRSLALGGEKFAPEAIAFESSVDLADRVAADLGGIGFVGFAYARNAKPVSLALACGLSFAPRPYLVRTEEYPLARRLFLYTGTKKSLLVQRFLRFAGSPAAQPIVEAAGFINLVPELGTADDRRAQLKVIADRLPAGPDHERANTQLRQFAPAVAQALRLSTTFRFEFDSADLDARANADLERVAAWWKARADAHGGQSPPLLLVGHASNQGAFDYNVALSRKRASEVGSKLAALGVKADAIGVGTISPVGCEDEKTRGGLNRRVEVWVR